MRKLSEVSKYIPEIKRLTKANSFTHQGRVIYIAKKDTEGKAMGIYSAYDYKTRYCLGCHKDKEWLTNFIKQQDLGVLSEVDT